MDDYTQLTVGAFLVLLFTMVCAVATVWLLIVTSRWGYRRLQEGRRPPSKRLVVVVLVLGMSTGLAAAGSCFDTYTAQAIRAYNSLDRCILETNDDPLGRRSLVRSICNANYVSDALQYAAEYANCMNPVTGMFRGLFSW